MFKCFWTIFSLGAPVQIIQDYEQHIDKRETIRDKAWFFVGCNVDAYSFPFLSLSNVIKYFTGRVK